MYFVYLLKSVQDDKLYVGRTSNLERRIAEHNSKKSFATKTRTPLKIVYYEAYLCEEDAKQREKMLKYYGQGLRRLKERLQCSLL